MTSGAEHQADRLRSTIPSPQPGPSINSLNYCVRLGRVVAFACTSTRLRAGHPPPPAQVINPLAAGTGYRPCARMVEKLRPVLGQPLVMDNKPWAGGRSVPRPSPRPPGRITLACWLERPDLDQPHVQKVPYDPRRISRRLSARVNPSRAGRQSSFQSKNVPELIALLRANSLPGKYSFSSSCPAVESTCVGAVQFDATSARCTCRQELAVVTDLVSGQVSYTIETVPSIHQLYVKSGRLRASPCRLAKRSAAMPELGTIAATLPATRCRLDIGSCSRGDRRMSSAALGGATRTLSRPRHQEPLHCARAWTHHATGPDESSRRVPKRQTTDTRRSLSRRA